MSRAILSCASSSAAPALPTDQERTLYLRPTIKRIIAFGVSIALLVILISSVDRAALLETLRNVNLFWFAVAMAFFIPQIFGIAHRWRLIAHPLARLSRREAGRQIVASNCLNLVLPSKLGDLTKGVFLYRRGSCRLQDAMHIVVFEKLLDLAALSAWMIVGWMLAPRGDWWVLGVLLLGVVVIAMVVLMYFSGAGARMLLAITPQKGKFREVREIIASGPRVMRLVHADGRRRLAVIWWSFAIWAMHLLQIYCFFRCLNTDVGLFSVLALMPIAIFAGLMPLTIAGIGVRDWAIVMIFSTPGYPPAIFVGVGLLISLRYVVPAAIGLPFVPRYFLMSKAAKEQVSGQKR